MALSKTGEDILESAREGIEAVGKQKALEAAAVVQLEAVRDFGKLISERLGGKASGSIEVDSAFALAHECLMRASMLLGSVLMLSGNKHVGLSEQADACKMN